MYQHLPIFMPKSTSHIDPSLFLFAHIQSISNLCQFYLQNISQVQSLLTVSTAPDPARNTPLLSRGPQQWLLSLSPCSAGSQAFPVISKYEKITSLPNLKTSNGFLIPTT